MTKIISIANQKGGVGKTITSINLSAALAHFNRKILLIDMDPQGDSSKGLGLDIALCDKTVFDVLLKKENINDVIQNTVVDNLDLLPAKLVLTTLDSLMTSNVESPYTMLKDAIRDIKKQYDYIIIDCPPSLGLLTINSLVASNSVLIPVQCEYFAMDAVTQMLANISKIQASFNKDLGIEGFLLTMYDSKTTLGNEVCMQIRGLFKENTFLTQVPRNISIPESNVKGVPVTVYRPTSSGATAYLSLAREIMDKE